MRYFVIYLKGMLMGAADLVPGVSGGTIALLTGIYKELLESINALSLLALVTLRKEGFKAFWKQLNAPFLLSLFGGIVTSILLFSRLLEWLIQNKPLLLWSFFFGLLVASILYLFRTTLSLTTQTILYLVFGILVSFSITQLNGGGNQSSLWYLFFSGFIAISAMILPGLSGAYILVVMGVYQTILTHLRLAQDLILNFDQTQWVNTSSILGVFLLGILIGIKVFSKALSWLLNRYPQRSNAVLVGLMTGALHKVWPWQNKIQGTPSDLEAVFPQEFSGDPQLVAVLLWMGIGFATLFILERSKSLINP